MPRDGRVSICKFPSLVVSGQHCLFLTFAGAKARRGNAGLLCKLNAGLFCARSKLSQGIHVQSLFTQIPSRP